MVDLSDYLTLLNHRAELLVIALVAGVLIGEPIARYTLAPLITRGRAVTHTLGQRLDRANRGIATLVYRGIIALMVLTVPAIMSGVLMSNTTLLPPLVLALWFGHALAPRALLALWQRSKTGNLPLELPGTDFLFVDTHAVIRHRITSHAGQFAIGVVGACLWFIVGGLPLMFAYLTLATAASAFTTPAFGWAARALFGLMDMLPRLVATLLLALASLFTPQTKPLRIFFARSWRVGLAALLDVALGGTTPQGDQPWVGTGTAKLTHIHLRRYGQLVMAATLLLILLLGSPTVYKLLISNN